VRGPASAARLTPCSGDAPADLARRPKADAARAARRQRQRRRLGKPAEPAPAPAAAPPAGGGGGGLNIEGLTIVKPPYGVLSAINLDRGELVWQVPHGDTPDAVRNSPLLAGKTIPKTGQPGSVGLVVTKSLVVLGDPSITTTTDHPRGAMFRAYDKANGKEVGAVWMPAPQSGSPMTYMANGRQYFIVAVSGGNYSGEYIAFALPQSEVRPTTAGAQR
jgi:quinoprotein glucose dehydrogenase